MSCPFDSAAGAAAQLPPPPPTPGTPKGDSEVRRPLQDRVASISTLHRATLLEFGCGSQTFVKYAVCTPVTCCDITFDFHVYTDYSFHIQSEASYNISQYIILLMMLQ